MPSQPLWLYHYQDDSLHQVLHTTINSVMLAPAHTHTHTHIHTHTHTHTHTHHTHTHTHTVIHNLSTPFPQPLVPLPHHTPHHTLRQTTPMLAHQIVVLVYNQPDDAWDTVAVFINITLMQSKSIFKVRNLLFQLGILFAQLLTTR